MTPRGQRRHLARSLASSVGGAIGPIVARDTPVGHCARMGSPPPLTAAFRAASFLFSLASVPARWPGRRYRLRYRPAPAPPPDPARPPPRRALRVNRNGLADPIGRRV